MTNPSVVTGVYNRRAKSYDVLMKQPRYQTLLNGILASVDFDLKGKTILDLGCGTGLATQALLRRFPDAAITGIDCSEEMLGIYRRRCPRATALIGDFNQPETIRASFRRSKKPLAFDLVVSTGAVSEYGDPATALPFVHGALEAHGLFINIGVNLNVINKLAGKSWSYAPTSKNRFFESCRSVGFQKVTEVKIPWRFFPNNVLKFLVYARK